MVSSTKVINIDEIVENIVKGLSGTGWDKVMSSYWESPEFSDVIHKLVDMVEDGKNFCPKVHKMFRWMQLTSVDSIKCVIMGIDRYNNAPDNVGIIYSRLESMLTEDKLRGEYVMNNKFIASFLNPVIKTKKFNYNLERWCSQGVLFFPYSPTYRLNGEPHYALWANFRARVIEAIDTDVTWLLMEEKCHKYENLIKSNDVVLMNVLPELYPTNWVEHVNRRLKQPIIW